VARAGRFGTKGLAITFVSDELDARVLNEVQERFEVNITELPEEIDLTSYSEYCDRCCQLLLSIMQRPSGWLGGLMVSAAAHGPIGQGFDASSHCAPIAL